MKKINILIIGAGHYSTGSTVLSGLKKTDKDYGVLLPSALELHSRNIVGKIGIVARDGNKLAKVAKKINKISDSFDASKDLLLYPTKNQVDNFAYKQALKEMPRPFAVMIAVPDDMHYEVMAACIDNKAPFMVVKPAVTKLNELYKLFTKLEKEPVLAMVDYHKVYDDANIILKDEYEKNMYGSIQHFSSLMTQRRDMLEIYSKALGSEKAPNINHYLGSHYIHMVSFITKAIPIDVRATSQVGVAKKMIKKDYVADIIQVQIRWRTKDDIFFTSYHVSGWSDPSESESMTHQEIHMICEKGHIHSDQRYRGFRKMLSGDGYSAPNPYFFSLNNGPGNNSIDGKYGFISVKTFIENCIKIEEKKVDIKNLEFLLPTLKDSEKVTAILEAADLSLEKDSKVIQIYREDNRYYCVD